MPPEPRFRRIVAMALTALVSLLFAAPPAPGATKSPKPVSKSARVLKVLPHFLDLQGRHTVNPSLFDRDAYQFDLRHNPERRSGMRFDVLWKGVRGTPSAVLVLRVELRGSKAPAQDPVVVSQRVFASGNYSQWTRLPIVGPDYEKLGELHSWRVSLWNEEELVAEQTSFLW